MEEQQSRWLDITGLQNLDWGQKWKVSSQEVICPVVFTTRLSGNENMPEPSTFLPHQLQPCHPNHCRLLTTNSKSPLWHPSQPLHPYQMTLSKGRSAHAIPLCMCLPILYPIGVQVFMKSKALPHTYLTSHCFLPGLPASCSIKDSASFFHFHKTWFYLYIVFYFHFCCILSCPFESNKVRDSCP